jgi:hypothetical protein
MVNSESFLVKKLFQIGRYEPTGGDVDDSATMVDCHTLAKI